MPHHTSLIATIVAGLGLAFVFGALAHRLRLSPLVGYLVAGVADRTVHAGLRGGPGTRAAARRDRRDPAHVRRRAALLAQGPLGGARHRDSRRGRPDGERHPARHGARLVARLVARGGPRLRPGAVGGEHGRAAARAPGAAPDREREGARRGGVADRRGPRHGPRAGSAAGPVRRPRRPCRSTRLPTMRWPRPVSSAGSTRTACGSRWR